LTIRLRELTFGEPSQGFGVAKVDLYHEQLQGLKDFCLHAKARFWP
jgi:hypothetical protein